MWDDRDFANYVVGQADANSSFWLGLTRDRRTGKFGIMIVPAWSISKVFDEEIVEKIHDFLGVGKVFPHKHTNSGLVAKRFAVEGKGCAKIVEFFEKFPLRSKKQRDFEVWKKAVEIYCSRDRRGASRNPWTKEELIAMLKLRKQLRQIPTRIKRREDKTTEVELRRLQNLT